MAKQEDNRHEFFERMGVTYKHSDEDDKWFFAIKRLKHKTNIYKFKDLRDAKDYLTLGIIPPKPFGKIEVINSDEYNEHKTWRPCKVGECIMDDEDTGPWEELCNECKKHGIE